MDSIHIRLLGGVEVSGTDVPPLAGRALILLGCLVTRAGVPQPRAHLAGLLWPDSDSAQARTNLRRELHGLRAAFGDGGALEVTASTLTWHDRPGHDVDVRAFLHARDRVVATLGGQDPDAVERAMARCLARYGGEFLPGCYAEWAVAAREELHRACVDLCDRIVDFGERTGSSSAALGAARRRIALEPLEEVGYRRLMRLQRTVGDRAGAMNTYHRCSSVLEQELGVSPSSETRRELDEALSDGSRPATRRTAPASLVGRATEQARLLRAWTDSAGGARFLVVGGDPGTGKTRMVADLAAAVTAQGGVVAAARCFTATEAPPLAPVAQWLRSPHLRLSVDGLAPAWRAEVARLLPELDAGNGSQPGDGVRAKVDAWRQTRFFEGLARSVLAAGRPVLLTLDDLQWSDLATLAWVSFLITFAREQPVLVVATAREEELGDGDLRAQLRAMRAAHQVETLSLGPLADVEVASLAAELVGRPLTGPELDLVCSVTSGNPFFVIEALRDVGVNDPVRPDDVAGMLAGRLSRLSEAAQDLVGLASAIGRDFDLELLIEAADLDADLIVPLVDELWRLRVLDHREHRYDFSHDLVREAAYAGTPPARRWLYHRRIAQALELRYGDRLDTVAGALADQYDRSGQHDRALPFYERAARQATLVFAHAEAVRLWERSLVLVADQPTSRARDEHELRVLEQLLPPLNALRGYASTELEVHERRCAALGARLDQPRILMTASIALFSTTFVQGNTLESLRWAKQATDLVPQCPDMAGQAHMVRGGAILHLGELSAASVAFARATELSGDHDSLPIGTRTSVHARGWWSHALWLLGETEQARTTAGEALHIARDIEHPYSLAVGLAYVAITQQLCDERSGLVDTLTELTDICEHYGFAYYSEWATIVGGWLLGGPAGVRRARAGIATLTRSGALARMPYWLSLLADLHRRQGDRSAALAALDAAEAFAVQHDDLWWLPEVLRARAELADPAAARLLLTRACRLALDQGSSTLAERCRADEEVAAFG